MATKVPLSMLAEAVATQAGIDAAVAAETAARNAAIVAAIAAALASLGSGIPAGTIAPYAGSTAPTGWLLAYGQAVSRTGNTAGLFAAIGTQYGAGDGSTTFNLPDLRGRVLAGKDDMGGTAAGRMTVTLTGTKAATTNGNITGLSSTAGLSIGMRAFGTGIGANAVITAITSATALTLSVNSTSTGATPIRFAVVDGATLGAVGGAHTHALAIEQMPSHTHTITAPAIPSQIGYSGFSDNSALNAVASSNGDVSGASGSSQAHPNMQPTMVVNYIIKAFDNSAAPPAVGGNFTQQFASNGAPIFA